ncbi:MAG: CDP-glycerol glycerophosphotransferase family protein [bacterium]|nr:CDP-glycerol glycerophosphotransferase family protein [bacterium]
MKTILISSFHILISRNIIATGVPARLASQGCRIVVVAPDYKRAYFEEHFGGKGVVIEAVDANVPTRTRRGRFFKRLAQNMLDTRTVELKQKQRRYFSRRWFAYFLFWLPARLAWHVPGAIRSARAVDYITAPAGPFPGLLERYRPDLVFATDIQNENDVALLQAARRRGVRTVGMVRSWDNLTNYLLRIVPDLLLVGTDLEREEAKHYHGVPAERIRVVGIPHYDRYRAALKEPRDAFLRSLGLDPAKKLITFTPIGNRYIRHNDTDRRVMDILAAMPEVNVIVRFPPADEVSHTDDFVAPQHMHLDRPGVGFKDALVRRREISEEDDRRLMHELYHSDIVVTGPSSIAVDAALFGKPVIAVDLYVSERPYWERCICYDYLHIGYVRERKSMRIVRNDDELHEWVRRYLADSTIDAEGRRRVARDLCGSADGRSVERIVKLLST